MPSDAVLRACLPRQEHAQLQHAIVAHSKQKHIAIMAVLCRAFMVIAMQAPENLILASPSLDESKCSAAGHYHGEGEAHQG